MRSAAIAIFAHQESDAMTMRDMIAPAEVAIAPAWAVWRARLVSWFTTCADKWAAMAAFEELSRLSDAQLEHRGLRSDTLARDLGS
jgi:hypothetical protein